MRILQIGAEYTIKRTKMVYNQKANRVVRKPFTEKVKLLGMEGSKYVFKTESGIELLIHKDDLVLAE